MRRVRPKCVRRFSASADAFEFGSTSGGLSDVFSNSFENFSKGSLAHVRLFRPFLFLLAFSLATLSGAEIRILCTTDLHGRYHPEEDRGGMARVTAAAAKEADAVGRANTLLIDCGDLLQGSREAALSGGRESVSMLNLAGFDFWIPGNHDFEFGSAVLRKRAEEFSGKLLAGNLELSGTRVPNLLPYKVVVKNGVRIAVIGLTNHFLSDWIFHPENDGVRIRNAGTVLDEWMPVLMKTEKPDVIVLAVHAGKYASSRFGETVPEVVRLAARHPQIDLILGGHSHETDPGSSLGFSGVWYAQAGAHGNGYLRAVVDYDVKACKRISLRTEFVPVGPDFPLPPAFLRIAGGAPEDHGAVCRNIPAYAGKKGKQELAGEFADAVFEGVPGTEIVFHGTLSGFRARENSLTDSDLFRMCPFENTVVTALLTAEEIAAVEREQSENRAFNMFQYTFRKPGVPERSGRRFLTAFNSYAAAGAGKRFPVLKAILERKETCAADTGIPVRVLFEKHMKEKYK